MFKVNRRYLKDVASDITHLSGDDFVESDEYKGEKERAEW